MPRDLTAAVVVITGAASGVGRAAARRFRQEGAAVVLTGRRAAPLEELATELGPEALAVPGDTTSQEAMHEVARRAVERFGRIDVWVNNASVVAFGRFEDIPDEAFQRVIDVNVGGYVRGARAAIPHLRRSNGALVNVGSINSRVPAPNYSPYITSKFAIWGLTLALRQELRDDTVDVGAVLPAAIDTPLFQEAGNWYGRRVKGIAPATDPDRIARAVVKSAKSTTRGRLAGIGARAAVYGHHVAPRALERLAALQSPFNNFDPADPAPPSPGNLYEPSRLPATERGGWDARSAAGPVVSGVLAKVRGG